MSDMFHLRHKSRAQECVRAEFAEPSKTLPLPPRMARL